MKKILSVIVLGTVLLLSVGSVAIAQEKEQLNDCCKIRQAFKIGTDLYAKGAIIGAVNAAWCDINGDGTADTITTSKDDWGMVCLLNTIYTVTNWIFYIMTLLAVLMIVFGGFTYITAAGDPAKAGKGKTILTYAIIGLAIALIAKIIPSLVRFILGM